MSPIPSVPPGKRRQSDVLPGAQWLKHRIRVEEKEPEGHADPPSLPCRVGSSSHHYSEVMLVTFFSESGWETEPRGGQYFSQGHTASQKPSQIQVKPG